MQVVAVEGGQDQGLVMGLVRAPGHLLTLLAVLMASAVRNFFKYVSFVISGYGPRFTYFTLTFFLSKTHILKLIKL